MHSIQPVQTAPRVPAHLCAHSFSPDPGSPKAEGPIKQPQRGKHSGSDGICCGSPRGRAEISTEKCQGRVHKGF